MSVMGTETGSAPSSAGTTVLTLAPQRGRLDNAPLGITLESNIGWKIQINLEFVICVAADHGYRVGFLGFLLPLSGLLDAPYGTATPHLA